MTQTAALVADDHAMVRLGLAVTLRDQLGFAVVYEAATLDDALERLADDPGIGLALIDLSMPGMDGADSLAALRECHPDLKLAVVTASDSRRDILAALDAGANGFIPKDMSEPDLVAALRTVMAGGIFASSILAKPLHDTDGPGEESGERVLPAVLSALTQRQREVLEQLIDGRSNKEIARALKLGEGTVKIHLAAIFRHFGVRNRAAAAGLMRRR
jgi:DNA-binding NarL/FixJ family response regulator